VADFIFAGQPIYHTMQVEVSPGREDPRQGHKGVDHCRGHGDRQEERLTATLCRKEGAVGAHETHVQVQGQARAAVPFHDWDHVL
jgi:hypothetical protein